MKKQKTPNVIDEINHSFLLAKKALVLGQSKQAVIHFVEFLKPIFCKKILRTTKIDVESYSKEVLEAMEYLASYISANRKIEMNFAKAAGIYQYCYNFTKKFNLPEEKSEEYFRKAHLSEGYFSHNKYSRAALKKSLDNSRKYQKSIVDIQKYLTEKQEECQQFDLSEINERSKIVHAMYKECNLALTGDNKRDGLVQQIIKDCFSMLPPVPKNCPFAICFLGSSANKGLTIWSDLEFFILVEEVNAKLIRYFEKFTELFYIKVINLSKTHLRSIGVDFLNNFKTLDDWFWDDITEPGLRLDSARPEACGRPTGRKNYDGFQDFDLIDTPQGLSSKLNTVFFKHAKHIGQSLLMGNYVYGSQKIFSQYQQKIQAIHNTGCLKSALLERLQDHLELFSIKFESEMEGQIIDIKQHAFRICERIICTLANIYGIGLNAGYTTYQLISLLAENNIISKAGGEKLAEALSIIMELRLSTYLNNKGQYESAITYKTTTNHLTLSQVDKIEKKTHFIKETKFLKHFFLIMLEVQEQALNFSFDTDSKSENNIFLADFKITTSPYLIALVHASFLEYKYASDHFAKAYHQKPKDLKILFDWALLSTKLRINLHDITKKIKEVVEGDDASQISNNQKIEASCILGRAYKVCGKYSDAINFFEKALSLIQAVEDEDASRTTEVKLCMGQVFMSLEENITAENIFIGAEKTPQTNEAKGRILHNMGLVYNRIQQPNKAIEFFLEVLEIYKTTFASQPAALPIAALHNNLGVAYKKIGEYEKALFYLNNAHGIYQTIYKDFSNHPLIAAVNNNKGNVFSSLGEFQEAEKSYQKSMDAYSEYKNIPPNKIAKVQNNFGNILGKRKLYSEALEYLEEASEHFADKEHCRQYFVKNMVSTAHTLFKMGQLKNANDSFEEALRLQNTIQDTRSDFYILGQIKYGLGQVALKNHKAKEAINYFQQSGDDFKLATLTIGVKTAIAKSLLSASAIHNSAKNFDKALREANEALSFLPAKKYALKALSHHIIAQIYANNGQYQLAIKSLQAEITCYNNTTEIYALQQMKVKKSIGYLGLKLGDYKSAREYHLDVLAFYKESGNTQKERDYTYYCDMEQICFIIKLIIMGNDVQATMEKSKIINQTLAATKLDSDAFISIVYRYIQKISKYDFHLSVVTLSSYLKGILPNNLKEQYPLENKKEVKNQELFCFVQNHSHQAEQLELMLHGMESNISDP